MSSADETFQISDERFEQPTERRETFATEEREPTPVQGPSGCRGFAMGCGCAILGLLVVLIGVGAWVAISWKGWAAGFAKQAAAEAVARSSLSPEDKARVVKRINSLADDFQAGRLTTEQAKRVFEEITNSPLLPIALVMAADEQYVKPSGLTDEEKETARRALQRLARGAFEKTIGEREINEVMQPLMDRQPDGSQRLKNRLTDEELKAFIENAKAKADTVGVPDEPFDVNIADELDNAIDRALK